MKIRSEITAYYPSDEGVNGGFLDALGKPLYPNYPTCAAPPEIPFHTMIKISDTNTKYDNMTFEVLDRGSAIIIDDKGIYHIDLLMHTKEECNEFGRRMGYIEILEEGEEMKTQNGFTLLENKEDVRKWLNSQKVTRTITRLQVHHMDLPNYSTWKNTDKKVFSEPHFGRTQSLNDYGKKTWNYSDGHGKYIAQHFNVFPDGKITTGRHLNSTPIGIRGWNTNAICVEIYGDFDKGKDVMTSAQKKAVIYLYGELCKRFKIPVDTKHIRPHCHFTAGGTYLGKYDSSRSAKTCPGTNFWGVGCSPSGFNKFLADIKAYVGGKGVESPSGSSKFKPYIARVNTDGLNARKGAGAEYDIECVLDKGVAITIIKEKKAKDGGTWCKALSGYWCNKKYLDFVRYK